MNDELKRCPLCNILPTVGGGMLVKPMCDCYGEDALLEWDKWQNRPIEDAAIKLCESLKERIERLKDELSFTKDMASQIDLLYMSWEEWGGDFD